MVGLEPTPDIARWSHFGSYFQTVGSPTRSIEQTVGNSNGQAVDAADGS